MSDQRNPSPRFLAERMGLYLMDQVDRLFAHARDRGIQPDESWTRVMVARRLGEQDWDDLQTAIERDRPRVMVNLLGVPWTGVALQVVENAGGETYYLVQMDGSDETNWYGSDLVSVAGSWLEAQHGSS